MIWHRALLLALLLVGIGSVPVDAVNLHVGTGRALLGGGVKPYLGQVATHSYLPNNTASFGATNQMMARSRHIMRAPTSSVSIGLATWWYKAATLSETAFGSTATVTASVEYPPGTCTPFTWTKIGGGASGVLPDNSNTFSDALPISIPNGAVFFIRVWWSSAGGFINFSPNLAGPQAGRDVANGENYRQAASGVVDQTISCDAITDTNQDVGFAPVAIVGPTTTPSFYLFGDSRNEGARDYYTDASTNVGQSARMVGPYFPYINGGLFGNAALNFVIANKSTHQIELAKLTSHLESEMGINDIGSNQTSAQLVANLATAWGQMGATRIFQSTIAPNTTSTDNCTTTGNQTPFAQNAARVTFNTAVRAGLAGTLGFLEVADVAEGTRNSGVWQMGTISGQYTASQATTVLNVSAVSSGAIAKFDVIVAPTGGVTVSTFINSLGSGTGGTGTYNANFSQTVTSRGFVSNAASPDCIHENPAMNQLYNTSGVFNPNVIHYPFLLKRDIDPAANDNSPAWLDQAA